MYFTSLAQNTEESGMHCIFGFNFDLSDGLSGGGEWIDAFLAWSSWKQEVCDELQKYWDHIFIDTVLPFHGTAFILAWSVLLSE